MTELSQAVYLAEQVMGKAENYPQTLVQCAFFLLANPDSDDLRSTFLEMYQQASAVRTIFIGKALGFSPEESAYYEPGELNQPGIEIGIEPVNGWTLKLFPEQMRRHCIILGMTGSGKTNLLQLIALGLGEIDK